MASNNLGVPSFPGTNSPQRISTDSSSVRIKVALKPGRSLMDWIRLGRSGQDLTSVGGKVLDVTEEELAKHNQQEDGWLSIRGKVYNVTPYMEYHPGGIDELKRGLGKDATVLFDEIHKWVNAESMLEKCFVGRLQTVGPAQRKGSTASKTSLSSRKLSANGTINIATLKPPESTGPAPPKFDWYQTTKCVTLIVYTKLSSIKSESVIIRKENKELHINVNIKDLIFTIHIELEADVSCEYTVKTGNDGKVEIVLPKLQLEQQWTTLGKPLDNHCTFKKVTDLPVVFHDCKIESVTNVTHDTKLFRLHLPESSWMSVPIGYHIHIHHDISGMEIVRSYTCVIPTLSDDVIEKDNQQGRLVYLMLKIYSDGAITPWLDSLTTSDNIKISNYDGNFSGKCFESDHHLVLYAAGTGFTPMIRLLHKGLKSNSTIKSIKLLFFNKKRKDIVWKDQLDDLAATSNNRLEVTYVLSNADDDWTGLTGQVRKDLIVNYIPTVDKDSNLLVCACGPIPFTKEVIRLAKENGCQESQLHAFLG